MFKDHLKKKKKESKKKQKLQKLSNYLIDESLEMFFLPAPKRVNDCAPPSSSTIRYSERIRCTRCSPPYYRDTSRQTSPHCASTSLSCPNSRRIRSSPVLIGAASSLSQPGSSCAQTCARFHMSAVKRSEENPSQNRRLNKKWESFKRV